MSGVAVGNSPALHAFAFLFADPCLMEKGQGNKFVSEMSKS